MYQELYRGNIAFGNGFSFVSISNHEGLCPMLLFPMSISLQENDKSIVGSVVECSPATRAARVRFPDDANTFFVMFMQKRAKGHRGASKSKNIHNIRLVF